jgi:hypothetical protein
MDVAFIVEGQNAEELIPFKDVALFLEWNADTRGYDQNIEQIASGNSTRAGFRSFGDTA